MRSSQSHVKVSVIPRCSSKLCVMAVLIKIEFTKKSLVSHRPTDVFSCGHMSDSLERDSYSMDITWVDAMSYHGR